MTRRRTSRGSIMIWTLLLGVSLAAVFLFFSQSLNSQTLSQQETMKYLNAKGLIESYADYIEQLGTATLQNLRDAQINNPLKDGFRRITGTLTNRADEIRGTLDVGDSITYHVRTSIPASDAIRVEWDACPANDEELLEITGPASISEISNDNCTPPLPPGGVVYNEIREFTSVLEFTLTAPAAPTEYKVSTIGDAELFDNHWHLELEIPLGFRKKIRVTRDFVAN